MVSGKSDPAGSWKKRRTRFIPTRITIIKRTDGNKCWWACGETGTPYTAGPRWTGAAFCKVRQSLRKVNTESPYDPAIPCLEMSSREMKWNIHPHKNLNTNVHSVNIHNSQKRGNHLMCTDIWWCTENKLWVSKIIWTLREPEEIKTGEMRTQEVFHRDYNLPPPIKLAGNEFPKILSSILLVILPSQSTWVMSCAETAWTARTVPIPGKKQLS